MATPVAHEGPAPSELDICGCRQDEGLPANMRPGAPRKSVVNGCAAYPSSG